MFHSINLIPYTVYRIIYSTVSSPPAVEIIPLSDRLMHPDLPGPAHFCRPTWPSFMADTIVKEKVRHEKQWWKRNSSSNFFIFIYFSSYFPLLYFLFFPSVYYLSVAFRVSRWFGTTHFSLYLELYPFVRTKKVQMWRPCWPGRPYHDG